MGRAPCCEKVGLNKGSWSKEEDQILISYIQQHGHPNWRALPKRAGLLRCGKSCRLRWTNYLRPDIKRGNFTKEEDDTIIRLHEMLGNRWSVIASKLPGRTDNEIKNVWHTHLKKRAKSHQTTIKVSKTYHTNSKCDTKALYLEESIDSQCPVEHDHTSFDEKQCVSNIQPSSSESSSDSRVNSTSVAAHGELYNETFLDDNFWSETLSGEGDNIIESDSLTNLSCVEHPTTSLTCFENIDSSNLSIGCSADDMYLWHDIFMPVDELPELPEF